MIMKVPKSSDEGGDLLRGYAPQIEKLRPFMYSWGRRCYGLQTDDAEDIFQETVLRLIRGGITAYDSKRKFSTWFGTCFKNTCKDYLRRKRVRRKIESTLDIDKNEGMCNPHEDYSAGFIGPEDVRRHVERLSPDQREVIFMYFWGDMLTPEIAERLGEKEGTIVYRFGKGRKNMKSSLGKYLRS